MVGDGGGGGGRKGRAFAVVLVLWGLMFSVSCVASRLESGSKQTLEVQKHLKRLNKTPVKSIQSPDGDIIDCISMLDQPAFDHPYLKDHKIQMRPNYHPEGLFDENKVASTPAAKERANPINQLWHQIGICPEKTIPVRRTKRDDVLRASSVKRYGRKKHRTIPQPRSASPGLVNQNGHQHAITYVEGDKYYGAKATINVWEPKIQQSNEFSLSQLWILGGSFGEDLNSIEAGWQVILLVFVLDFVLLLNLLRTSVEIKSSSRIHRRHRNAFPYIEVLIKRPLQVSPDLYGDNNTRLFTYWTSDAYQATGCYNLLCSGFIQINNEIAMGASISPISAYRSSQYDISILIWKDPSEGHWWMQFGNDYVLGYWPSFLFSYLTDSASMIEWGGEVVNSQPDGEHTSTQMGSGHFPEEGFGKASYFRNIQVVDESNNLKAPKGIGTFTEQSNCYDVQTGNNGDWGHYFYYGGPGKNPKCL
ncbi:hypothetical protein SAY87_013617 [Trapa incisa]|uniref:Neprosin PEP catalytic domain-containing protein n=1 Tax=Trapa incisa TaxID=236973 RepID=A0AAN7QDA8_9MYRT|nr:hypothetical protein SAY87_013617 [Trapa incisa]